MLESKFQKVLCDKLKSQYPGAIILKNDSSYLQGIPDWLILYRNKWAAFEAKASRTSWIQPNQPYYVDLLNKMSFCSFVYPENEKEFLHEIQSTLRPR